jgi:hypothetical protein
MGVGVGVGDRITPTKTRKDEDSQIYFSRRIESGADFGCFPPESEGQYDIRGGRHVERGEARAGERAKRVGWCVELQGGRAWQETLARRTQKTASELAENGCPLAV